MLGLKEIFIKRYIAERTNKAEIRLEEESEKAERCQKNVWYEIQLKGYKERDRHKNTIKEIGKLGWFMSKT